MRTFSVDITDTLAQMADAEKLKQMIVEELVRQLVPALEITLTVTTRDVPK